MRKIPIPAQMIIVLLAVILVDLLLTSKSDASMLIALLFWAGVAQGMIALAAAADLSSSRWIEAIRPYLQAYYPLLLLFPMAFLIFARHVSAYAWVQHPTGWLNPRFFIIRNILVLLLPFFFAHFYVRAFKKGSSQTGLFAVAYLVCFVISQCFMAFDQVMTFEYPWINTLFGGFFFVEALYAGIAFSAILAGLLALRRSELFRPAFRDFTTMVMGFALLWAGLFYSQYLVIWYGNIPDEVSFIAKRLAVPSLKYMGIYILLSLFLLPFLSLVSRKVKAFTPAVILLCLLVHSGLIVERLIYLIPVVNISPLPVTLHLVLLSIPFLSLLISQYNSISQD